MHCILFLWKWVSIGLSPAMCPGTRGPTNSYYRPSLMSSRLGSLNFIGKGNWAEWVSETATYNICWNKAELDLHNTGHCFEDPKCLSSRIMSITMSLVRGTYANIWSMSCVDKFCSFKIFYDVILRISDTSSIYTMEVF